MPAVNVKPAKVIVSPAPKAANVTLADSVAAPAPSTVLIVGATTVPWLIAAVENTSPAL